MPDRSQYGGKGWGRHFQCFLLLLAFRTAVSQVKSAPEGANTSQTAAPTLEDRQKAMQADMDRLLQLARQLKVEVDKTRRDELSLRVIRDADEIDKLARSARGRIR